MGGETMGRILARGLPRLVQVRRLVLSPHTAAPELRRQLVSAGWTDVAGGWVHERGQHYPVAGWERGSAAWTEADYRWGRAARAAPGTGLMTYLQAEQSRMAEAHAQALEGRGEADREVRALQQGLSQLSEELSRLR
jgi:tRNA A22 N-methylase